MINKATEQVEWVISKFKKLFKMNLQEINQLNFEEVLQKQGIEPTTIRGKSFFYMSPFRPHEKTASFHVTKSHPYDLFYDHGEGIGGKIVDFFIKYLQTDPKGVLNYFNENSFSFQQHNDEVKETLTEKEYKIIEVKDIESIPLIQYLESRKIPLELAQKYCKEIHYRMNNRNYFAIAFPTENGFEIRNKHVKMCLNGKGFSWILNGKNKVKLFESWSDFLSYLVLFPKQEFQSNFLILNSVSLLRKQVDSLEEYQKIETFLDTDNAGKSATKFLLEHFGCRAKNISNLFEPFKDVNDFLIHSKNAKIKIRL